MTQYIFDTCSLNVIIKSFYEKRFPTFWDKFDELANDKAIISIKEVKRELTRKFDESEIPIADPLIIAKAEACNGVVVTEEVHKPNANKIPNVCEKRNVRCINLERFMEEQNWSF